MSQLLQFLFSGLTVGAIYAVVAIGFTLIYAASDVVNFAQGEFVMLGGLGTVFLAALGLPVVVAAVLAILMTVAVGLALQKFAIEWARDASPVTLIIILLIECIRHWEGDSSSLLDERLGSNVAGAQA